MSENSRHDSPSELIEYRKAYLAAIDRASKGELVHVTRNSHVISNLFIAAELPIASSHIVNKIAKYIFGGDGAGGAAVYNITLGSWFKNLQGSPSIWEIQGSSPFGYYYHDD